jgi:hypothetical protein
VRRFVFLWAILGAAQGIAGTAVDLAAFRRLDLTYEAFCAALLVPAAQAAALLLIAPSAREVSLGDACRRIAAHPSVRVLLAADVALIAAAFVVRPGSAWSASRAEGVLSRVAAAQAAIGGLLALGSAPRAAKRRDRALVVAAGAVGLVAAGFATPLPGRLLRAVVPRLFRALPLMLFGEVGLAVAAGILLAAAPAFARRLPAAGRALDAAVALELGAATIVALHLFRLPLVSPPWDGVVRALLLAASGVGLASAAATFFSPRAASGETGP